MKKIFPAFILVSIILISGCISDGKDSTLDGEKVVIYKSANCGCCGNYVGYAEGKGFDVKVINLQDTSAVKAEQGIPASMQSCHTTVVGDYFVEGHIPIEAIDKLLTERPDIDGIAMPGMPSGSPGMPGYKKGEWVIYALKEGVPSEFMRI